MLFVLTIYVLPLLLAGTLLSWLAAYAWRHRATDAAGPFVALLVALAITVSCGGLEHLASGLEGKMVFRKLASLGRFSLAPSLLVVALYVTGRAHGVRPRLLALLAAVPVPSCLLALSNGSHHLVWAAARLETAGSLSFLALSFGPVFWLNAVFGYGSFFLAFCLLAARYLRAWESYRQEAPLVLGALAAPAAVGFLYMSGAGLLPRADLMPHAFAVTGLGLSWGLLRRGALDVVPVAPIAIVEEMGDGVIVVDMSHHLVYANPAARRILHLDRFRGVESMHSALAAYPDLIELFLGAIEGRSEIALGHGEERADFDLQISPLASLHGAISSRVLVLRDITDRKRAQEDLQRESACVQLLLDVAVAANEASSIDGALEACLGLICSRMNWAAGYVLRVADTLDHRLLPTGICHLEDPGYFEVLRSASRSPRFPFGEELPRRVLTSAEPCWIADVTRDSAFERGGDPPGIDVRSAMAFPVVLGAEVISVFVFFAPQVREPDRRMLDVVRHIGTQIGRVIERVRAEGQIRELAFYDSLTGLANRQLFQEGLESALRSARRYDRVVGLLFVDLDGFKHVNDTLGHSAGDRLLCEVAERFTRAVRESDRVGRMLSGGDDSASISRLGGDEFTILLTEISCGLDAAQVAQRLLDALTRPVHVDGHEVFASCSIGIALHPTDGGDAETLLRNADTAMYCAKSRGHSCYEFYSASMSAGGKRRLSLESRLRQALGRGEFSLVYQPQRDAFTSEVVGGEALLRWVDPELGPVGPDEFIPIAEETGLILSIGEWVLRTACMQWQRWSLEGYRPIRLAVNFSGHQIRQHGMLDIVSRTLRETGLSPAYLELEITESTIMLDDEYTNTALCELAGLGVSLALDDFGTGYSSLAYLRRFPLERVKIDRSFIGEIVNCPEDAALAAGLIALAHSLQLKVVAEGVETREQVDFLREHRCDELQGFFFSRPVPPQEFVRFLERNKREEERDGEQELASGFET